jgi:hypothetical protein
MNALRTIAQEETPAWVALLLREGPHAGDDVPDYPPRFLFTRRITRPLLDSYLYLVYQDRVYAYGRIAGVVPHPGGTVGTFAQRIRPGDAIVLDGPAVPFPFALPCRGFTGIRYTPLALHELPIAAARRAIRQLRLPLF